MLHHGQVSEHLKEVQHSLDYQLGCVLALLLQAHSIWIAPSSDTSYLIAVEHDLCVVRGLVL